MWRLERRSPRTDRGGINSVATGRSSTYSSGMSKLTWRINHISDITRHAVVSRIRRARGRSGEFPAPEDSNRARMLTDSWISNWGDCTPVGHVLTWQQRERWVRFHSLPGSQRYAHTPAQAQEILRRHRVTLAELSGRPGVDGLLVIAHDYDWRDRVSGWSKKLLVDAWPWQIIPEDQAEDTPRSYLWVKYLDSVPQLEQLLAEVAAERADIVVTDSHCGWLYAPYDGGADVVLTSVEARNALRSRHLEWLPTEGEF